jgi:hypothetical protein
MQPEKRLAAIVMVCAGVASPGMGMAQSADGNANVGQGKVIEQVIVTGSRVKRPEFEGNIPGVQTDAEQIELRNFDNAIDVLNDIPLVGRRCDSERHQWQSGFERGCLVRRPAGSGYLPYADTDQRAPRGQRQCRLLVRGR